MSTEHRPHSAPIDKILADRSSESASNTMAGRFTAAPWEGLYLEGEETNEIADQNLQLNISRKSF